MPSVVGRSATIIIITTIEGDTSNYIIVMCIYYIHIPTQCRNRPYIPIIVLSRTQSGGIPIAFLHAQTVL